MKLLSCIVILLVPTFIHAECCRLTRVTFKIPDTRNYGCSDFGGSWHTSSSIFRFGMFIYASSDSCEVNICGDGSKPTSFIKHCGKGDCSWGTCGCESCIEGNAAVAFSDMHGLKIQDVKIS